MRLNKLLALAPPFEFIEVIVVVSGYLILRTTDGTNLFYPWQIG